MMLRPLQLRDADALFALESSVNAFPWSRHQFDHSFQSGHFGWGFEPDRSLRAFALFQQILDEATLLNIVVHPDLQRQGMARKLLLYAFPELVRRGAARCLLEVRVSNAPAIGLYRSLGFGTDGKRRDYYPAPQGREDALLMSRDLPGQTVETI
jgi:[ribosomal protein S18]-alanine N-acetyltransferase